MSLPLTAGNNQSLALRQDGHSRLLVELLLSRAGYGYQRGGDCG